LGTPFATREPNDIHAIDLDGSTIGVSSRMMQRASVDFPEPDSPMSPKLSPRVTANDTASSAVICARRPVGARGPS